VGEVWAGIVWAYILIVVWLRGNIWVGEWCCEVVGSCEVQLTCEVWCSTSSQPDKNLCVCVIPESSATLTNCRGYSRRSGFIAVDGCATLTMTYDLSRYMLTSFIITSLYVVCVFGITVLTDCHVILRLSLLE